MRTRQQSCGWRIAYRVLCSLFVLTAALNLLHIRAGFATNYLADLVVPAMLYVFFRHGVSPQRLIGRFGRTPERAVWTLFAGSALTELSQVWWPEGVFAGRFDPVDIVACASGLLPCYVFDRLQTAAPRHRPTTAELATSAFHEITWVDHASVHTWIRPHLFAASIASLSYWTVNLILLIVVWATWRRSGLDLPAGFPILSLGMVGGFLILLPVHEWIHAFAYRVAGAPCVVVRYDLRRITAQCLAPNHVVSGGEFTWIALAPFLVLTPFLALAAGILTPGGPQLAAAGALLLHTGACSGDIAFASFVARRPQVFPFDDVEAVRSGFFAPVSHSRHSFVMAEWQHRGE